MVELLRSMDIFAGLTDEELAKISRLLREHRLAENEVIFAQGEGGDALYVLLQGRVRVSSTDSVGRERVLAFYGPGEFFGDTAVLTGEPRSDTATASTNLRLLELRKDDFDTLVATNVSIMRAMLRVIVKRQAALRTRVTQESGANSGDMHGQVTTVFSAAGGAGKTLLATNLAVALAELTPDRVVVVGLDLLFGNVAMLLDLIPRTALSAITPAALRALDADSLTYYLTKHPESSLRVLAGTLRPEESKLVTGDHVRAMLSVLSRHFIQVVIDAGSRFSEPCLAALELADQVFVVSTPDPTTVHDVVESQRVLRELLQVPSERIRFIQNRPSPYGKLSRSELAEKLNTDQVSDIPFGGEEVSRWSLKGFPLVMGRPANPTSRAIISLAYQLNQTSRERGALAAR